MGSALQCRLFFFFFGGGGFKKGSPFRELPIYWTYKGVGLRASGFLGFGVLGCRV